MTRTGASVVALIVLAAGGFWLAGGQSTKSGGAGDGLSAHE
jgi:hypothetical protein